MNEYNYHDWAKYMVTKPEQAPKGPHFAGILFGTRTEYTPAYDRFDSSTTISCPEITYFCFYALEDLERWVLAVTRSGKSFFFFQVPKLGESKLRIEVHVDAGVK